MSDTPRSREDYALHSDTPRSIRCADLERELAEARQRIDNLQRDREMLDREVMKGMAEYDEARAVLRRLVEWASDPSKPLIENHADIVAAARKFL